MYKVNIILLPQIRKKLRKYTQTSQSHIVILTKWQSGMWTQAGLVPTTAHVLSISQSRPRPDTQTLLRAAVRCPLLTTVIGRRLSYSYSLRSLLHLSPRLICLHFVGKEASRWKSGPDSRIPFVPLYRESVRDQGVCKGGEGDGSREARFKAGEGQGSSLAEWGRLMSRRLRTWKCGGRRVRPPLCLF